MIFFFNLFSKPPNCHCSLTTQISNTQAPPQSLEWARPSPHVHRTKVPPNPNPQGNEKPEPPPKWNPACCWLPKYKASDNQCSTPKTRKPQVPHQPKEESDLPTPWGSKPKNIPIPQTLLTKPHLLRAPKRHPNYKNPKHGRRTLTTQKSTKQNKKTPDKILESPPSN